MDTSLIIVGTLSLGAIFRLSRLVVEDSITKPFRDYLERRAYPQGRSPRPLWRFLDRLTGCTWCTSVWVAFAVLAPVYAFQGYSWWTYPLAALTASWLTGIVASWLDSPPPPRHVVHHLADPVRIHLPEAAPVPGQTTANS